MATLTTQTMSRQTTTGLRPTYAAATGGGDAMATGQYNFLHIKNTGGSAITVTLVVPTTKTWEPNVAITSPAVSVPSTTGDRMIGPIDPATFTDPVTGLCSITYSGVTGVTVAAIQIVQP